MPNFLVCSPAINMFHMLTFVYPMTINKTLLDLLFDCVNGFKFTPY